MFFIGAMHTSRCLFAVFGFLIFATGCTRIDKIEWESDAPLIYQQQAVLEVTVKPGLLRPRDLDAMIEDGDALAVVDKTHQRLESGEQRSRFTVVPTRVGKRVEAFIRYGNDRSSRKRFEFEVHMPAFSGRSNASFLEMAEAPDTSVYGSHITIWPGEDVYYVSGHAASNICREVSAAVIDFATSRALLNDEFFLGAGFASLPIDYEADSRLAKEMLALPHPASLTGVLEAIQLESDEKAAYDLADLLDAPWSYQPRPPGAEHFAQVIQTEDIDGSLDSISTWIHDPSQALSLLGAESGFEDAIQDIRAMSEDQRSKLAAALRRYAALLGSGDLLERTVSDVGSRSGLIRQGDRLAPDNDALLLATRRWAEQSIPGGEASLLAIAARAEGLHVERAADAGLSAVANLLRRYMEEAQLQEDASSSGLVFLPFVNAANGKDVVFELPQSLFISPRDDGKESNVSILDTLRKGVTVELVSNLKDAARRQQELYEEALAADLPSIRREFEEADDKRAWLRRTTTKPAQELDDRARPTGRVIQVTKSNFEWWINRLLFAEEARRRAVLYEQSARRVEEAQNDPRSIQINDVVLLDSFLRGWDLAFVDNAAGSPYRSWIASHRTVVWSAIFDQARQQGIDIAPLVSEQTVFQVRAADGHYEIRPRYVGDLGDTTAVRSADDNLVFYRSPWSQRQVAYLQVSDVREEAWTEATARFNAESPQPALEVLVDAILESVYEEKDGSRQREAIRRAFAVNAQYTAQRLLNDYWALWPEAAWVSQEHRQFERLLSRDDLSDTAVLETLGGDPESAKVERFTHYMITRSFEGGLRLMLCLSEVARRLEEEDATPDQTRNSASACFSILGRAEQMAMASLELNTLIETIREEIKRLAPEAEFDALGRSLARNDLQEAMGRLAAPLLQQNSKLIELNPSRRAVRAQVRLQWYSGNFLAALSTTLKAVHQQVPTPAVEQRARLLASLHMELLKAMVYSGLKIENIGDPTLAASTSGAIEAPSQLASLDPRSVFGLRDSDFAMWPKAVDRIAYRIAAAGEGLAPGQLAGVPGHSRAPLPKLAELGCGRCEELLRGAGDSGVGVRTQNTASGLRKEIVIRDENEVHAAAFADLVDAEGKSRVANLATLQAASANRVIDLLRSAGFELLQGKKTTEELERAVLFAYPDQLVVVAGDDILRFAPPTAGIDVAEAARAALRKGDLHVVDVVRETGLLDEARRIAGQRIDASEYFRKQSFPGLLAFARDDENMRLLVLESDGTVTSKAYDGGQLRSSGIGIDAIRDMEAFERGALASRSDDRVQFIQFGAFDAAAEASTSVQIGRTRVDVPISEVKSLLGGENNPTPVLDAAFQSLAGEPTMIVYRDAFARAGGGGRQPPIANGGKLDLPDPDREPMKGVYASGVEHVPPVSLLLALQKKYPAHAFRLDDELDIARTNALEPVLASSPKDVGAYLPAKASRVLPRGAIVNIRQSLEDAGVQVESSMKALAARNVLVISGHKDQAMEAYVEAHIEAGNFKGRTVVLFSCYGRGDSDLAHRVISAGGARAVVFYAEKITPRAVNAVVVELARTLQQMDATTSAGRPFIELLDQSVEQVLERTGTPEAVKKEVAVLRNSVPQLSRVFVGSRRRAA